MSKGNPLKPDRIIRSGGGGLEWIAILLFVIIWFLKG